MDRLTKNDLNEVCYDPWELCGMDEHCTKYCHEEGGCTKGCHILKMYRKLAEYEDLEEQGLLLKLPCKEGDILYTVSLRYNKVETLPVRDLTHIARLIDDECIGQYVFLTREEAEKALKQMREKMEVLNETHII